MTETPDPSVALEEIKERHALAVMPDPDPVFFGSLFQIKSYLVRSDVPRLVASLEAVLELADELEATPYPDGADVTREQLPVEVARTDVARGLGGIFREAITREITGAQSSAQQREESSDG